MPAKLTLLLNFQKMSMLLLVFGSKFRRGLICDFSCENFFSRLNVNADWRRGAMQRARRAACDGGCCCINIIIFAFFNKLYGLLMG